MKVITLIKELLPELKDAKAKAAAAVITQFVPDNVPDHVVEVMRKANVGLRALGVK